MNRIQTIDANQPSYYLTSTFRDPPTNSKDSRCILYIADLLNFDA